jgi:hypothetical protein
MELDPVVEDHDFSHFLAEVQVIDFTESALHGIVQFRFENGSCLAVSYTFSFPVIADPVLISTMRASAYSTSAGTAFDQA